MKRFLKWSGLALAALLVAAGLLFINVWYFKPVSIDAYYARVYAQLGLKNPERLTSLRILERFGLRGHNARLNDASPEADRAELAYWKEQYAVFKRYDRDDYKGQDLLSYDIWDAFVGGIIEDQERWRLHGFPVNQMFGVHTRLPNLMLNQHVINDELGAEHYVARLGAFGTKFDQVIAKLAERREAGIHPPAFAVTKVINQIDGFIEPEPDANVLLTSFDERVAAIPLEELGEARRRELRAEAVAAVEEVVYPAYRALRAYFVDLSSVATSNDGVWRLPDGEAFYQFMIEDNTTTTLTADEIHAIGLREVARLAGEMDEILRAEGLTEGSIGARVRQLATRPDMLYPDTDEGREQVLADYQAIVDEITPAMPEYFRLRPSVGVEVRRVPEFAQENSPIAYYRTPSLDGQRPGVFYVNLRNLEEIPRFSMRSLAYHEAIPGHHFQLSIAQQLEGLPLFRNLVSFTAYTEGWAMYTEQLAREIGFQEDPLDNLGRLQYEIWRAVRLVVDTGMHARRWSREEAIAYMLDNTGLGEEETTAEIERYLVMPGQALSYKIGMIKILELRERARNELGDAFDLRDFHDQVIGNGSLPLNMLERMIDEWITERRR